MTDSEFQQTKRILLEQERMNREYTQLANYIQERLSVQVINVTCTKREDSINLTLWFKYENEANSFYKERFVVDSRCKGQNENSKRDKRDETIVK
jgi:hypothetical protein